MIGTVVQKCSLPLILGIIQGMRSDSSELERLLKVSLDTSFKKLLECKCPVEKKEKSHKFLWLMNKFLKKVKTTSGWSCRKPREFLRPFVNKLDRVVDKIQELKNPLCFHTFGEEVPMAVNNILEVCNIPRPLEFRFVLPPWALRGVHKITEGSYGEVYVRDSPEEREAILKIMTVYGSLRDDPDTSYEPQDAVGDVVCSKHLSTLSSPGEYHAPNFPVAFNIQLVKGKPPKAIVEAWKRHRDDPGSEATAFHSPDRYSKDSLFMLLDIENCGSQFMNSNQMKSMQAISMVLQTASALAVAESAFEFEHRDLHIGNWLCKDTTETEVSYSTPNRTWAVPTYEIKAYIIDFTMSRIKADGKVHAMNLSYLNFDRPQEYQPTDFKDLNEVYFAITGEFEDDYHPYKPKTNVWWLLHLCSNALDKLKEQFFVSGGDEKDRLAIFALEKFKRNLRQCSSCMEFLQNCYFGCQSSHVAPAISPRADS